MNYYNTHVRFDDEWEFIDLDSDKKHYFSTDNNFLQWNIYDLLYVVLEEQSNEDKRNKLIVFCIARALGYKDNINEMSEKEIDEIILSDDD